MTMSLTRATYALRSAGSAIQRRNLAILPTVKVASDTSKMDFPAPSHVSLSSEALNIAKQVTAFYANPGMCLQYQLCLFIRSSWRFDPCGLCKAWNGGDRDAVLTMLG